MPLNAKRNLEVRMSKPTQEEIKAIRSTAVKFINILGVQDEITRIADELNHDFADSNPIIVQLLNGATVFAGQLIPQLTFDFELDYIHATRYGSEITGDDLKIKARPSLDFRRRHIILLDDLLDKGHTLAQTKHFLLQHGAESVAMAVMFKKNLKPTNEPFIPPVPEYQGALVPDEYVFGMGLDYKGYLRNMPGLYFAPKSVLERFQ